MIYEYECEIHKVFEVQQSISDKTLEECPHCKADGKTSTVKKLISMSSFVLNGKGWARDNYS